MWTPKNYLHEKVIDALLLGGFKPLQIQFLGWLSYTASALNHSRNPVKAAHTLLANASDPQERLHKMLLKFQARKTESIKPVEIPKHDVADKLFDSLADHIDDAMVQAQMRASTYEDFTKGGVSDGEGSITDERDEEVDEVAPEEDADGAAV